MERVEKLVGGFLRQRYSLTLIDLYSKLRTGLLDEMESVVCNLCGGDDAVEIARRDKYGLPLTSVMCRSCGLMYLNPRPTVQSYDRFYSEGGTKGGVYHVTLGFDNVGDVLGRYFSPSFQMNEADHAQLRDYVRGKYAELVDEKTEGLDYHTMVESLERRAREFEAWRYDAYAADIYQDFKEFVPRGGRVFEMGASWGKLLLPWREQHGCEVSGIEPRRATVQAARDRLGIELFEGVPSRAKIRENQYDAMMIIRTINHMMDPLGDLRHAWRWLKPGGVLLIDIADAIREAEYESFQHSIVEVDHPYMFSISTLSAMVQTAGFSVVSHNVVDTQHVFWGDRRKPQMKQIRLVSRKNLQPIEVNWPDPLLEMSALFSAQLAHEDVLRERMARRKPKKSASDRAHNGKSTRPTRAHGETKRSKGRQQGSRSMWGSLASRLMNRARPTGAK